MTPHQKAARARITAIPRLTRADVAEWLQVKPGTIQDLELGRQTKSLRAYIQALAVHLSIPVDWFYDGLDTPAPTGAPSNSTLQSPTFRWSDDCGGYLVAGAPLPIHPGLQPAGASSLVSLIVQEPGAHGHRAPMGAVIFAARELDVPDTGLCLFHPDHHLPAIRLGVLDASLAALRFTTLSGAPSLRPTRGSLPGSTPSGTAAPRRTAPTLSSTTARSWSNARPTPTSPNPTPLIIGPWSHATAHSFCANSFEIA